MRANIDEIGKRTSYVSFNREKDKFDPQKTEKKYAAIGFLKEGEDAFITHPLVDHGLIYEQIDVDNNAEIDDDVKEMENIIKEKRQFDSKSQSPSKKKSYEQLLERIKKM
ncbi:MAG: hypothetical protein WC570_00465 [Patescibacteria group bacterium]